MNTYQIACQTYHAGPWDYVADIADDWRERLEAYETGRDDDDTPTDATHTACAPLGIDPHGNAADAMRVKWTEALDEQDAQVLELDEYAASMIAEALCCSVVRP